MSEKKHPLYKLHGCMMNGLKIHMELGRKSPFGAQYFFIYASDAKGRLSQEPAVTGLFNSGVEPAYNWIEFVFSRQFITFHSGDSNEDSVYITRKMYRRILQFLSNLLPPGSHFMVEYDSPQWLTTRKALTTGVPTIATPLGSLLYDAGFGARVKNWDLAEGGREGWRKLWGYKALNDTHARMRAAENARELIDYLVKPPNPDSKSVERIARLQARRILKRLPISDRKLKQEIETLLRKQPHPLPPLR